MNTGVIPKFVKINQYFLNSSQPKDNIGHNRSGSSLVQVIACCLIARSSFMWTNASLLSVTFPVCKSKSNHYSDIIMGTMVSQITSIWIVYSTVCSGADQRKDQSSASLAFVRGIHRWQRGSNAKKNFHLMTSWCITDYAKHRQWFHGTKPVPEPMLTYHQWGPVTFTQGQFLKRYLSHQWLKWAWKWPKIHSNLFRGQWLIIYLLMPWLLHSGLP